MYMQNAEGEFVPVNAEALAAQLESDLQPEIERLADEQHNIGLKNGRFGYVHKSEIERLAQERYFEMTDGKVWLTKEQYDKRLVEARADELTNTHIEGFLKHNCGAHAICVEANGRYFSKEQRLTQLTQSNQKEK